MKRFGTALAAVALVALCATAGCNDYGNTFQGNTGALLTSLSPANIPAVAAGGPDLTLTVIGAGFVAKTVVQWDGKSLVTNVTLDVNNNVTKVTATVPAALLATPGRHFVNTLNPSTNKQDNGLSNTLAFIVTVPANPAPVLTSISPTIAAPGSGDVTLTATGSSFVKNTATGSPVNGSIVQWNTGTSVTQLSTTFGSATSLTATVPASLLTTQGCVSVTVFTGPAVDPNNPQGNGGGGTSSSQTFTISTIANFCPAASQSQAALAVAEETPAVSADGRFVAYTAQSGTHSQIFLRDTCEGAATDCKAQTNLLSAAQDSTEGNADSHNPSISSDGRFIAFGSSATNLAAETPDGKQIFLRDTCHGAASGCKPQTQLVSVDPSGQLSATDNLLPSISSSGRFIAFLSVKSSTAKTTAGQMNNGVRQVFVRDTCLGAQSGCTPRTMRISTQPGDENTVGGKPAGPAVSGTGAAVGITDNHSATRFTHSVTIDDRVFLAITKNQN
ncbi:MAG: PD40 domain-containing protein [Acidobacteria bacterium]|nr:PD40 domain-containing protein [Acidobacteriota bacterium]MBS1864434.1 PD40 domain-containing protein [Acidobacteriota bacterium]